MKVLAKRAFAVSCVVGMLIAGLQGIVQNWPVPQEETEAPSRASFSGPTNLYVPSSQTIRSGTQTEGTDWDDLADSDDVRYAYEEEDNPSWHYESILPNANGDTTAWTVSGTTGCTNETDEWDCLNDQPTNDGDSTYVKSTSKMTADSLENLGTVDLQGGSVSSVVVTIWCRKTVAQAVGVRTAVKTYGTVYAGASDYDCPNSSTYGSTSTTYTTNPYSGAAWTQGEIDALQAGCRDNDGSSREVRCTEVRVDVTYSVPMYMVEVEFSWSDVPVAADAWTLVVECTRLDPGAESVLVQVAQDAPPVASWVTAYTCDSGTDESFATYELSAAELNEGAPTVRVWDAEEGADATQGTMTLDVLRIDLTVYATGRNAWQYYIDGAVNAATGGLHLEATDLTVKALGWDLAMARSYNSGLATVDGLLGYGWTFPYDTRIVEARPGIANWYAPDGGVHTFRWSGGAWVSPPGVDARLTESGTFTLWFKDGSTYAFDADGRLDAMTDRNGNAVTLAWSGSPPALVSVEDDSGLCLNFTSSDVGTVRILSVRDPIGRTIEYGYDGNGDLRTVTDAMGNATYYTYDAHRLVTWREPGDASASPAPHVLKVTYAYEDSRVSEVRRASVDAATNATEYEYVAWSIDYADFSSFAGAVAATNATDANAHVATVDLDFYGSPLRVQGPPCGVCADLAPSTAPSPPKGSGCGAAPGTSCGCSSSAGGCGGSGGTASEEVTLSWDANRNLLTRTDNASHEYAYTYDAWRNVINATDPSGNVTQNVWTVADNATAYLATLNETTNARGYPWYYEYDGDGNLERTTDPTNNATTNEYDAHGYVTKTTDARGYNTSYEYDAHGYLLNRTDATGNTTSYEYDGVGRLTKTTVPDDHAWETEYDANDRVVTRIDPLGNETTTAYDARGDVLSQVDALGRTTEYEWNVTNHKIAVVTDALGNTTSYAYDFVGNLATVTNPRGFNTSYAYDEFNRRTQVTDALGNATNYAYDDDGLLTSIQNRRGYYANYTHDNLHRLLTVTDALGNVTTYSYDEVGNVASVVSARGFTTTYAYDALNRRTRVTDTLGNVTHYEYDENGNLVNATDPNGNSNMVQYDALNRPISAHDGEGEPTTFAYDSESNRIQVVDANLLATNHSYDALSRLTVIADANGNTTEYGYDAVGNLLNLTDANGHTTMQEFDALDRLTKSTSPLGKATDYTYDENGNRETRQDANGNTTTYTYDALDRLTKIAYPNENLTFAYDEEGNRVNATGYGFTRTEEFDALNRVTSTTFDYGSFSREVEYTYDEVGNRATMRYPEGQYVNSTYDALDRLTTLADSEVGSWNFTYDAGSRVTRITYPSGLKTEYIYDKADWILEMYTNASGGSVIESFEYTYDDVGNRLTMTEDDGNVSTYVYDDVYRLTSESYTGGLTINYTYDGVGNRLTDMQNNVTTNYTYDADSRLTAQGNVTFAYADNGDQIRKTVGDQNTTYVWDFEDRLSTVTFPNATSQSYKYSTSGDRLSRTADGDETWYGYDFHDATGLADVIAEFNASGALIARYVHGPGADRPMAVVRGGTYLYSRDALGSVTRLTTTSQATNAQYRYQAFGSPRDTQEGVANPYRFTSREFDGSARLYFYRARYYDSDEGRFVSKDPIGIGGGTNPYSYVENNPTIRLDPSGLRFWEDWSGGRGDPFRGIFATAGCTPSDPLNCVPCIYRIGRNFLDTRAAQGLSANDKFAHCWVTCEWVRTCGIPGDPVLAVAALYELLTLLVWVYRTIGAGSTDFQMMNRIIQGVVDVQAGYDGILCGARGANCYDCCRGIWGPPDVPGPARRP